MVNWISNDYNKVFLNVLKEDSREDKPSDEEIWNSKNEKNQDEFDIKGLDLEKTPIPKSIDPTEYTSKIDEWKAEIDHISNKLESMFSFAADLSTDSNANQIYKSIGSTIEKIQGELGSLSGSLKTLGKKIEVSINQNNLKTKEAKQEL